MLHMGGKISAFLKNITNVNILKNEPHNENIKETLETPEPTLETPEPIIIKKKKKNTLKIVETKSEPILETKSEPILETLEPIIIKRGKKKKDTLKTVEIDKDKLIIIELFRKNVKDQQIELNDYNKKHNGKEGHWLEERMNIEHNSKNEPDILGYEMKKESIKITFGDFSASEYLFSKEKKYINETNGWDKETVKMSRDDFIRTFGTKKPAKNNRYSWSGECVPTFDNWNNCGQNLIINKDNDICIYYSWSKDNRENKNKFPEYLKKDNILIVLWKYEKMSVHIDNKFNNKGFFIIKKEKDIYNKICFGKAFNYECFINGIKSKQIIFDSGMVQKNTRNYSKFRSNNTAFWNELIIEEYE